jgi:hypothetical protein
MEGLDNLNFLSPKRIVECHSLILNIKYISLSSI